MCAALCGVRDLFQRARGLLKQLGQDAGVEIEPDAQTALLDASLALPGVLAGAVPGAGGHDAVFVLTLGDGARRGVEELWARWREHDRGCPAVCALLLHAASPSCCGIQVELDVIWDS